MKIDKEYWKKLQFVKGNFPELLCPTCCKGHLKVHADTFKNENSHETSEMQSEDWFEFYHIETRFSMLLKCDNTKCHEIVSCLGKGFVDQDMEYHKEINEWEEVYRNYFIPLYFHPSIHIIPVSNDYPKTLRNELVISFSHFFADLTSCANKIRICIEILMDELNIKRFEIRSGKRASLSLHSRILEYKKVNQEVADYLLAIKWIGNFGSHFESLTKDDILDAYLILDHSLNKIYDNQQKAIETLTKKINKRKAPLSKIKRKSST